MSTGAWIGDESIIYERPMEYSVQVIKPCKVLSITVEDFLTKIPKDILQYIEQRVNDKVKAMRKRYRSLHNTNRNLAKLESKDKKFNSTVNHVKHTYPVATQTF